MKAKRRHELQENVLAIELGKVVEFLKRRGNHLATGVLVVAIILLAVVYIGKRTAGQHAAVEVRWDRVLSGEVKDAERIAALTELAEQSGSDRIAALAGVELGDEYARRRLTAKQNSERDALLEKASAWYLRTIQNFPRQDLAVAKARFGVAKLAETAGNWDRAAEEYRKIQNMGALTGQPVVLLAEAAFRRIGALKAKVRMASTAPATQPTQPASRPTTQPAAKPTTQPASQPTARPAAKLAP